MKKLIKSKLSAVLVALLCTITLCIPTTTIFSFAADSTAVISQSASGFQNFAHTATYRDGQFTDVNSTDWFANDVKSAFEIGMMIGDSDTTFNPSGNVTIAETATIAARLNKVYATGTKIFDPSILCFRAM